MTKSMRNKFTKEEDDKLRGIIQGFMSERKKVNWDTIASIMKTKNTRQCKDRWFYYLSDQIDRTPFTPYENYLLLWSINNIGKKWTQISTLFPGRTDVIIKLQYRKLLRRNATLDNVMELPTTGKLNKCMKNMSANESMGEDSSPDVSIMDIFDKEIDGLSKDLFEDSNITL